MALNPIAFGGLLSGSAGLALIVSVRNLYRARKSVSWPMVNATIVDASVLPTSKGFRPRIVYKYRVAERSYESDRVVVGSMWGTSGDSSARLVRKYSKGSATAVAVDPAHPGYSVLLPGIRFHQVFTAILCAVAFAATLTLLWVFADMEVKP